MHSKLITLEAKRAEFSLFLVEYQGIEPWRAGDPPESWMMFKACLLAREIRQGCRGPANMNTMLLDKLKTYIAYRQ